MSKKPEKTYEDEAYADHRWELIDFPDKGNTSIEVQITFDKEKHSAYANVLRCNNDGDTKILVEIPLTWEQAKKMLD
jgi:hypothetical protein